MLAWRTPRRHAAGSITPGRAGCVGSRHRAGPPRGTGAVDGTGLRRGGTDHGRNTAACSGPPTPHCDETPRSESAADPAMVQREDGSLITIWSGGVKRTGGTGPSGPARMRRGTMRPLSPQAIIEGGLMRSLTLCTLASFLVLGVTTGIATTPAGAAPAD